MSAYPGQWELLGVDSDPWPGDSAKVTSAAQHYRTLATAITDQARKLRTIAEGNNQLVGKYQPELTASANDLADYLERAENRFDTVATELTGWSTELDHAQTTSRDLLRRAESEHDTITTNVPATTPPDPSDHAAVSLEHQKSTRTSDARQALSGIQSSFDTLKQDTDRVSATHGKNISDASQDSLKNHHFDGLRKWVHDHADLLKEIADVLTWIATAIVIAALIIGTGGLALAAILTAGALLLHTILALNGDGSWVDVGIDAFALLTFGTGKLLTSGAKGALALREATATFSETSSLARSALADVSGLSKAVTYVTKSNPIVRSISGLSKGLSKFDEVMKTEFEGSKLLGKFGRVVFGDDETAALARNISGAADRLGPGRLLDLSNTLTHWTTPVWRTALGVDGVAKVSNSAHPFVFEWPGIKPWVDWSEEHTVHGVFAP